MKYREGRTITRVYYSAGDKSVVIDHFTERELVDDNEGYREFAHDVIKTVRAGRVYDDSDGSSHTTCLYFPRED